MNTELPKGLFEGTIRVNNNPASMELPLALAGGKNWGFIFHTLPSEVSGRAAVSDVATFLAVMAIDAALDYAEGEGYPQPISLKTIRAAGAEAQGKGTVNLTGVAGRLTSSNHCSCPVPKSSAQKFRRNSPEAQILRSCRVILPTGVI